MSKNIKVKQKIAPMWGGGIKKIFLEKLSNQIPKNIFWKEFLLTSF